MSDNIITNPLDPAYYPPEGTPVATAITPGGTFGATTNAITHYAKLGQGGYRTVKTYLDLDNIPEKRLELGMMVNVIADGTVSNNGLWILDSIGEKRNWKKLSIDDNNLNNNAFQYLNWNSENFPTTADVGDIANDGDWKSIISPRGWYLGAAVEYKDFSVTGVTKKDSDVYYKLYLTSKQYGPQKVIFENSNYIENKTKTPEAIFGNNLCTGLTSKFKLFQLLSIHLYNSYINNFLVVGIDDKYIIVKIVNWYDLGYDNNPFAKNLKGDNFESPFDKVNYSFKGTVVISGYCKDLKNKTSFDATAYNKINTLFSLKSYSPETYLTSDYISSGDVELGYNNIASGPNNKLGAFNAGSFGNGNELFDGFPTAFGRGNKVHGFASSAIGQNNKVIGEKSIAIGANNTITAAFSFVSGNNNKARGYNGFIPGNITGTSLHAGFTIGGNLNTIDLRSSDRISYPSNTVFGYGLQSKTPGQTLFGKFNEVNDSIFAIGNGTASAAANRSNAFEVTKEGLTKANGGLTVSNGNLQITDGYLNLAVYKENSNNGWDLTEDYGEVKLVEIDGELVLNITDTGKIASLPSNVTVNNSIEMQVYDFNTGKATGNTASLQCVQLGEGDAAKYSLRVFR